MMKVRLFVEGQGRTPGRRKTARAAYLMSYVLRNGQEATRNGSVAIADATVNRAALSALDEALGRFTNPSDITLYISVDNIRRAISNGWLKTWKENGWKKQGGEIKDADLWEQVSEKLGRHIITCAEGEELNHEYKSWLQTEIEKQNA